MLATFPPRPAWLALILIVGCGGGSAGAQLVGGGPAGGSGVPACVNGTVATYIGTSCSQENGAVVYRWITYTCASIPTAICTSLGSNGSNLQMQMDPNGPNTILVGRTALWNVAAGQSVDVSIAGTVYGARSNGNWPHFNTLNGQSGDGTEENITTVGCAANCLDSKNGVSDVPCSASEPLANCTDQSTIGPYHQYQATFNPATAANPYSLTIEIKLDGNAGTATLFSVGTHLTP